MPDLAGSRMPERKNGKALLRQRKISLRAFRARLHLYDLSRSRRKSAHQWILLYKRSGGVIPENNFNIKNKP